MLIDREQVWWIVPAGHQMRHAITARPGSRPSGDAVPALCSASVKLPYETWPLSSEPASRNITHRCRLCEEQLAELQRSSEDLLVTTWDC